MTKSLLEPTYGNCAWIPGYEYGGDLGAILQSWPYLPHLQEVGDRGKCAAVFLGELERQSTAAGGSLRLSAQRSVGGGLWIAGVRRLSWDSEFFGFGVGSVAPLVSPACSRIAESDIAAGKEALSACLQQARACQLEQLSASVNCADTLSQLVLQAMGFTLMDTIVGFRVRLAELPRTNNHEPAVRDGKESDVEAVAAISAECFGNRAYNVNRFNSDHRFPQQKVREMYACWIRNAFRGLAADHVLVYELDGRPVGFVLLSLPSRSDLDLGLNVGKIPLNAVDPAYHGRGLYGKLVRAALEWMRNQGVDAAEIRTQLSNVAVHKAWAKVGAHLAFAEHRFHLSL
ncbi:MAG TPA: GNAT family N-acetyltransferase [Candidatus Obscuribacterales bacterium]